MCIELLLIFQRRAVLVPCMSDIVFAVFLTNATEKHIRLHVEII